MVTDPDQEIKDRDELFAQKEKPKAKLIKDGRAAIRFGVDMDNASLGEIAEDMGEMSHTGSASIQRGENSGMEKISQLGSKFGSENGQEEMGDLEDLPQTNN